MLMKVFKLLICLLACIAVASCSYLDNKRKVDYKNTKQSPPLEMPPDLASVPDSASGTAPSQPATYSGVVGDKPTSATPATAVLPQVPGVSLERDGQTRWLLVQASPESLFPYVRQFVTGTGLAVDRENPNTGVIETDWVDTPAKGNATNAAPPAKWLSQYPSSATRDKFRVRLERGAKPGTTEIYIAHYGLEENRASGASRWLPRAAEPDIEAEMLRLLVVYLGKTDVQSRSIVAQAAATPTAERAQLMRRGDSFMLSLDDSLDRAWRRVGLSLDRVGFTVEDRDRSKGIYYVRYLDPDKQSTGEPGWFSRMFTSSPKKAEERYQIRLQVADAKTQVLVKTSDGGPEFGNTSERILGLLYDQLK
jgi:outer membrane protein assembly factor BamC